MDDEGSQDLSLIFGDAVDFSWPPEELPGPAGCSTQEAVEKLGTLAMIAREFAAGEGGSAADPEGTLAEAMSLAAPCIVAWMDHLEGAGVPSPNRALWEQCRWALSDPGGDLAEVAATLSLLLASEPSAADACPWVARGE